MFWIRYWLVLFSLSVSITMQFIQTFASGLSVCLSVYLSLRYPHLRLLRVDENVEVEVDSQEIPKTIIFDRIPETSNKFVFSENVHRKAWVLLKKLDLQIRMEEWDSVHSSFWRTVRDHSHCVLFFLWLRLWFFLLQKMSCTVLNGSVHIMRMRQHHQLLCSLLHPAGTSEISDLCDNITNFWPIEVNGKNFFRIFPLKNLQISERSQHIFRKLVYSLTMLCVAICY